MAKDKRTATPADAKKRTTTKEKASGVVLPVTDPVDLWYLCEKIIYANLNPLKRSDDVVMYQRVVTQLIRLDCEAFNYTIPYAGEVGYDMTKSPPEPIMSKKEPHRPSCFPLSQYRAIKKDYEERPFAPWLEVDKELLSLDELEAGLSLEARDGKPRPFPNGRGMIRIPDVIRMSDFTLSGKPQFSQPNIYNVIEIKFGEDPLRPEQIQDYKIIAGDRNNFRVLFSKMCDGRKRRTRKWVREAKREPVYVPVGKAMERAARRRNRMSIIPEYELLVDAIDREHQEVRREITPEPVNPNHTYMSAAPSPAELERRAHQSQHGVAGMEIILVAPFLIAAAGTAVVGAPLLVGGGVAEPMISAQTGAKIIQFPRVLRPLTAATGAAAATEKLAAQPLDPAAQPETLYSLPTTYVYWPD